MSNAQAVGLPAVTVGSRGFVYNVTAGKLVKFLRGWKGYRWWSPGGGIFSLATGGVGANMESQVQIAGVQAN